MVHMNVENRDPARPSLPKTMASKLKVLQGLGKFNSARGTYRSWTTYGTVFWSMSGGPI